MLSTLHHIDSSFSGVLDVVTGDLTTVKTGRAKPDLVAHIPILVESYGSTMALMELASVTAPDPQTLVIAPWDKSVMEDIAKGLSKSDLNLNPQVSGDIIRIVIPALTGERRQELAKLVDKKVESAKVLLRDERGRIKKEIDAQKGDAGVSEDDIFNAVAELDKKTKDWESRIEEAGEGKKKELLSV